MAVASVVEHAGRATPAHAGQHVGHRRTQASLRHDAVGLDARKALLHPIDQRLNAVGANVAVVAVEPCRARHPDTIRPQPARHQFGRIVKQADMRRQCPAEPVLQIDGDGLALDRINIHPATQRGCKGAAGRAGAVDHCVEH